MSDIVYRCIDPSEWARLIPLFNRRGFPLPHPKMSTAAVAEVAEGPMVGAWILQLVPHMEPLVVDPDWQGKVAVERLYKLLDERAAMMSKYVDGYIISTTSDDYAKVFEQRWHLQPMPWRVFRKEF